jgi:predicted aconitase with swiveling domain
MPEVLHAGRGEGDVLVLDAPLSFWGGVDEAAGTVIDVHHPQHGAGLAGRVLLMPSGRGSSSSSSVLAELIRNGHAPSAILLREADPIVALGALVAAELYGTQMPVLALDGDEYAAVARAARLCVSAGDDGRAEVTPCP